MVLTKAIRISKYVWQELNDRQPMLEQREKDFFKEHPEEGEYVPVEITSNMVIVDLLENYDTFHSVEYKEKQQKKIEDSYVPKKQFEELYEENRVSYEQDKKTINFLQEELTKSFAVEENLKIKIQEQLDINTGLQRTISDKVAEISELNANTVGLSQQQIQLTQSLAEIQNKYTELVETYNQTRSYIDTQCVEKSSLDTLFYVCQFLFKYKKHRLSIEQIDKALWKIHIDEIRHSLELWPLSIFPVVKIEAQDGDKFQYDRHYLRIPLAQVLGFQ